MKITRKQLRELIKEAMALDLDADKLTPNMAPSESMLAFKKELEEQGRETQLVLLAGGDILNKPFSVWGEITYSKWPMDGVPVTKTFKSKKNVPVPPGYFIALKANDGFYYEWEGAWCFVLNSMLGEKIQFIRNM